MTRTALAAAALLALAGRAVAYEGQSTHVGMTERAALAAKLHATLVHAWGQPLGLYEQLAEPALPALHARLLRLDPVEGLRPDNRRNSALGYLLAGAAIEDLPPARARNHFYDPTTGAGLHDRGVLTRAFFFLLGDREVGGRFHLSGRAAPDWATAPASENDLSAEVAWDALEHAATTPEPAARQAALAHALVALGAIAHLVQDMASPSRVRNDFVRAHLVRVPGSSMWDARSLYERYVAAAYGRLGVPGPTARPERPTRLRDPFYNLATWVRARFFSPGTLPREIPLGRGPLAEAALAEQANRALALPAPRVRRIVMRGGAVLGDEGPSRLATMVVEEDAARFRLDDAVYAAYARVLLPRAVQASAEALLYFTRGKLEFVREGNQLLVKNHGVGLRSGTVRLLTEDGHGVRRELALHAGASWPARVGDTVGQGELVASAEEPKRVIAVVRGIDDAGEPIVAIEDIATPAPATPMANVP
jgi:hypothetical protein